MICPDSLHTERIEHYFEVLSRTEFAFSPRYTDFLFHGVSFRHTNVLDIGGGAGLLSFYAAVAGAKKIVCIEPEAEGSSPGVGAAFTRLASSLEIDNVTYTAVTFQDFDPEGTAFDIVIANDSINHLDERACITLRESSESWGRYREIFKKILARMSPGGIAVITDCARMNVFPILHLTNPLSRTIEWHKHQSPYLWQKIMESVGFVEPEVRWEYPLRLGGIGRLCMSNRIAAFFHKSRFVLRMRKPG